MKEKVPIHPYFLEIPFVKKRIHYHFKDEELKQNNIIHRDTR